MGSGEKLHIQFILPESDFLNYSDTNNKESGYGNKTRSHKFQGGREATLKRRLLKVLASSLATACITIIPIPDWSRLSEHFLI